MVPVFLDYSQLITLQDSLMLPFAFSMLKSDRQAFSLPCIS